MYCMSIAGTTLVYIKAFDERQFGSILRLFAVCVNIVFSGSVSKYDRCTRRSQHNRRFISDCPRYHVRCRLQGLRCPVGYERRVYDERVVVSTDRRVRT